MPKDALSVISGREWVLTNGLGGYALGYGNMQNKRKYNGLLVAGMPDLKRIHILSSLEEKADIGDASFFLDSNHYPNCVFPDGYKRIVKAWLRPYPCALYSEDGNCGGAVIFKKILLAEKKNAVIVEYKNLGNKNFSLSLRPKFTLRDHHHINGPGAWNRTGLDCEIQGTAFKIRRHDNGFSAYGYAQKGEVIGERIVFKTVFYPIEASRGYDAAEDLIAPVLVKFSLAPGEGAFFICSDTPVDDPMETAAMAEERYKALPLPMDHPDRKSPSDILALGTARKPIFTQTGYEKLLEFSAQDFLTSGDDIIAGYPWFGVWSRDTLISMGGLKFLPNGQHTAVKILKKYGAQMKTGLLPNTFGEGGEGLNYDSIDAPLWFALRCYEFAPSDPEFFSKVSAVVLHYLLDESHTFVLDESDGLIDIRRGNHALTWMDAKVYDSPVTPRWGKPVEINALWFNTLCIAEAMAKIACADILRADGCFIKLNELTVLKEKVGRSMQKFIGHEFLADRLDDGEPVWETRPNAVTALSLPFDFADKKTMRQVFNVAKKKLLTTYGLRTLDPENPAFKQRYIGNQKQRDMAYHQGTVWAYLLSPMAKLAQKVLKDEVPYYEVIKEISGYIWVFRDGYMNGEMASVAEVWDGMNPYFPKGCPAQAWGVFALIEIEHMLAELRGPGL